MSIYRMIAIPSSANHMTMNNLDDIIDKIDKHITEKDKVREESLRLSRDVIITCRKAIQQLHRTSPSDILPLLKKGSALLIQLYDITRPYPDLFHAGYVENAAQEFVEAHCLYNIIRGEDLPDPDSIQTTYSSYLLGLCDVVGELRRSALDFMLVGESQKAHDYLHHMDKIYDAIMSFDYPSALVPIKKKQDVIRALIEKTRGELVVATCEQRISDKTHTFHGILDQVTNETKAEVVKKKEPDDIDVDKVW